MAERLKILKSRLTSFIWMDMLDIKENGNDYAHKRIKKQPFRNPPKKISSEEYYKKFEGIIDYYVNEIGI
ncbi:hypothetical protein [Bacillus sp. AFS017274]|uniref:hypothetical protein n=1 Tax=Bacillus sp. AFS017274 TaxID=2033488 RepID=UPI000BF903AD|nr:hypothetical protein [Bacillus sp. AFS017274]PEZ76367.1 hypothetical protein CN380_21480 [Bacillus sp. AFS017274]